MGIILFSLCLVFFFFLQSNTMIICISLILIVFLLGLFCFKLNLSYFSLIVIIIFISGICVLFYYIRCICFDEYELFSKKNFFVFFFFFDVYYFIIVRENFYLEEIKHLL